MEARGILGFNRMLGLEDQSCKEVKGVVVLKIVSHWFNIVDYNINLFNMLSFKFPHSSYFNFTVYNAK